MSPDDDRRMESLGYLLAAREKYLDALVAAEEHGDEHKERELSIILAQLDDRIYERQ